jgi:hypothetical protein
MLIEDILNNATGWDEVNDAKSLLEDLGGEQADFALRQIERSIDETAMHMAESFAQDHRSFSATEAQQVLDVLDQFEDPEQFEGHQELMDFVERYEAENEDRPARWPGPKASSNSSTVRSMMGSLGQSSRENS